MNKQLAEKLLNALFKSWSIASSSKWSAMSPAKGQCGVTALVVNDLLGGEIFKTKLTDGWHFYNKINGERFDFTKSQFDGPIEYTDLPSNREEAYSDTNASQYKYLKESVHFHYKD